MVPPMTALRIRYLKFVQFFSKFRGISGLFSSMILFFNRRSPLAAALGHQTILAWRLPRPPLRGRGGSLLASYGDVYT